MTKKNLFQLVEYDQPCELKFAARCLPLGLTAYGDTREQAWDKLKAMFAVSVDLNVKHDCYEKVNKGNE